MSRLVLVLLTALPAWAMDGRASAENLDPPVSFRTAMSAVGGAHPTSLQPLIPFRTGNLSVDYLMALVRGKPAPAERMLAQLDQYRDLGFRRVEDYITLAVLERGPNEWDWAYYDQNCEKVRAAGLEYGLYPWLHFAPEWYWTGDGLRLTGYLEARTGREIRVPSIWAPSTRRLFAMTYQRIAEHFGPKVSYVSVGLPADYGEVGYPAGMANWVVPVEGCETGLWCGDRYARSDFRRFALERYGDYDSLSRAWGTSWTGAAQIVFPTGPAQRRYWLDFVDWYYQSMTDFTVWAVGAVRKFYPTAPLAVKVGHGSELYLYGSDYTMVPKMAGKWGFICSYPGAIDYFPCKRIATACRFYGAATCTEPPGSVEADKEIERLFFDVCLGADEHFNYPGNFLGHPEIYRNYSHLLAGEDPECPLAVFFPTTTHRLRPDEHFPHRLLVCCNPLRDHTDYDVVDEIMIRDGALDGYAVLVCPEVDVIEKETVPLIEKWVRGGGILLAAPAGSVETVEGKPATLLTDGTPEERMGEGIIFRPARKLSDEEVPSWVGGILRDRIPAIRPELAQRFPDLEADGVLVCSFPNRVVAFNQNREPKSVILQLPGETRKHSTVLKARTIEVLTPGE